MVCNRLQQSTKVTLQWYRPCRPFLWSAHNVFSSFNNVYSSSVSSDQKNQNRTFTKLIQVVNIVHLSQSAVFVQKTTEDVYSVPPTEWCWVFFCLLFFFVKLLPTTKSVSTFFWLVFTSGHHLEESVLPVQKASRLWWSDRAWNRWW